MTKQSKLMRGFSLLELLIAVFILAFGLLGVAGMYTSSFKRTEDAYWRALAASLWAAGLEQQKTHDDNFSTWKEDCVRLLPHGECRTDVEKISVCWQGKEGRQCL